nr:uncharacterized protein LOC109156569 [Ipomoea batatas]
MAWRTPAANMVRPSTMANPIPQMEGGENLAGSTHAIPNLASTPVFYLNDRANPLHLHPNESPSLQLVTAPLEGRVNYHAWARAMEMALRSKNKIAFVNGTMVIPSETDPKYFYWDQCNTMVLSWILRAVSPTIGRGVLWINTAEGVWKDMKKRFSQQDVFRIAEIKSEIYQTKQGTSSVNEYFTQLKLLWDELLVLRPIPSCFAKGVKGYKLLDINTREVFLSRDVSFYEDVFPFQISQDIQPSNLVLPAETMSYLDTDEHIPVSNPPGVQSMEPEQANEPAIAESNPTHQPRRSTRTRIQPAYLNDYTCQNAAARRTSPHEISKFMSYDSLSTAAVHSNSHRKVLEMTQQKTGGKNGIPNNEACRYRVDCGK